MKEIDDFFGTQTRLATLEDLTELGLDSRYVNWNLNTKFNAGEARVTGAEFNFRHSLRPLGEWGNHFAVFANATKLKLEGSQQADFRSFIPKSANWGVSFNRRRVTLMAKWNYRGLDKRLAQPAAGPDAFQYLAARTTLDLNATYRFSKNWSLSASATNVLNVPQRLLVYGSATPAYAKQLRDTRSGVAFGLGLRGNF